MGIVQLFSLNFQYFLGLSGRDFMSSTYDAYHVYELNSSTFVETEKFWLKSLSQFS